MTQNVEKVLIIGLGMIGASIALASKSKGIKVIGFDLSKDSMKYLSLIHISEPTRPY